MQHLQPQLAVVAVPAQLAVPPVVAVLPRQAHLLVPLLVAAAAAVAHLDQLDPGLQAVHLDAGLLAGNTHKT